MEIMHDLGCVQIDPVSVVAPSHYIVLFSRLGPYDRTLLDKLLWEDRRLFEDWGHCTSIVVSDDYPIFSAIKREFSPSTKFQNWLDQNQDLRLYILRELRQHGSLPTSHFKNKASVDWTSTGWTQGRNVSQMLQYLWAKGKIMVVRREGTRKIWDLTERSLPTWIPDKLLSYHEASKKIGEKALRALGVAQPVHIRHHYVRGIPEQPVAVVEELEAEGKIEELKIKDENTGKYWRGSWYTHTKNLDVLYQLEGGEVELRTTLLSPFDNLIYDRKRTEQLFQFRYRFELYVPKNQRQYGCYVLPILHGDQFIGRIDSVMNRKTKVLIINTIYAEPNAPQGQAIGQCVVNAIDDLGTFLDADEVVYPSKVPNDWKKAFT
jgi:uncharacterized protein YcaQ